MDKLNLEDIAPTSEVIKSRRNLVVLAFSVIAYSILAPTISEIKVAGIEIRFADNNNINALIIGGLIFESITFFVRFINAHFAARLSSMIDERIGIENDIKKEFCSQSEPTKQATTNNSSSALDLRSKVIESWLTRLESIKMQQEKELKWVVGRHRFVELHMPYLLVSIALTLCIRKFIN